MDRVPDLASLQARATGVEQVGAATELVRVLLAEQVVEANLELDGEAKPPLARRLVLVL